MRPGAQTARITCGGNSQVRADCPPARAPECDSRAEPFPEQIDAIIDALDGLLSEDDAAADEVDHEEEPDDDVTDEVDHEDEN